MLQRNERGEAVMIGGEHAALVDAGETVDHPDRLPGFTLVDADGNPIPDPAPEVEVRRHSTRRTNTTARPATED